MLNSSRQTPSVTGIQFSAGAIAASSAIYAVVLLALRYAGPMPEDGFVGPGAWPTLLPGPLLAVIGAAMVLLSFTIRKWLERWMLPRDNSLNARFRVVTIGMQPAIAAGMLGLIYALVTGDIAWGLVLLAMSFFGCLLQFPGRHWLEQADDLEANTQS